MKRTENYKLPQIELEDNYDIEHFNDGWRKTDEELKRLDLEVQKRVNYDDTEIRELISETNTSLDTIVLDVELNNINNVNNENVTLRIKSGTVTTPIKLRNNMVIDGLDKNNTILKLNGNCAFINKDLSLSYENLILRNFTLDLTGATAGSVASIHLKKFKNVLIENVDIINGTNFTGIYTENCSNVVMKNCSSNYNKYGFSICGSESNEHNYFENCKAIGNSWDGFLTNNLKNSMFINCYAENNGYSGIDGTACGYFIAQESNNVKLIGCTSKNNGGRGFELDKTYNCKIIGCECDNDKEGIKVIGTGGINNNTVIGCHVICDKSPIIVMSSKFNSFTNLTLKTTVGTNGIFEDILGGSNANIFENIHMDGLIKTPVNTVSGTSKYNNIFLGLKPIAIRQTKSITIYLDFVNGNDNNNGESTTPIKTVNRLMELIEMDGQTVTIKVLGETFCLNQADITPLTSMKGQGKIIFDFENRTITSMPGSIVLASNDVQSVITFTFKNVTFSPTSYKAIYNYGCKLYFEKVNVPSHLTIECLSGGRLVCSNCNIVPQMKRDNGSYIMKDRWDTTSTIHVGLTDLSPS